ncbi:Ig-like domain-containing protein [Candidatus Uhrbacteria bacterium]|nr:Ig-like domain-containing protein [Candidatus Uhrbacteria bacterium]
MQTSWRERTQSRFVGAILVAAVFLFVGFVASAFAQTDLASNLATVNDTVGLGTTDIRIIIARIVRIVLGFLGVIAVSLMIYAGFLWMTSAGDSGKIDKAKSIMINAGIGLVIILSSLAITQFVLNRLGEATGLGSGSSESSPEIITPFSSALGTGIVETHYPRRSQTDVARNSNIVVTFREEIDPSTVAEEYVTGNPSQTFALDTGAIHVYPSDGGESVQLESDQVQIAVTADLKTIVLNPSVLLGSAAQDVWYTVALTGSIKLATGEDAFSTATGYEWEFQTSTEVDLTPPKVQSVIPLAGTTSGRNILVQILYSEAVNPVSAVGTTPAPFSNLQIISASEPVAGFWSLNNGYRTSEFVSDEPCGTNSCGETIYCLPPLASVTALAQSADLVSSDSPEAVFPYTGVVDMAGNALDGDADGVAEGRPGDNYSWQFNTNDTVVLDPPHVVSIVPPLASGLPASGVPFDAQVRILFDSFLSTSTVNADNVILHSPSETLWFNSFVEEANVPPSQHEVVTSHGLFSQEKLYGTEVTSGVMSIYQNCFTPSSSNTCVGPNCCNENPSSSECSYPEFTALPSTP